MYHLEYIIEQRSLRNANQLFSSPQQQDAHEFLNFLLNDLDRSAKTIVEKANKKKKNPEKNDAADKTKEQQSFVQELFRGTLTNDTKWFVKNII